MKNQDIKQNKQSHLYPTELSTNSINKKHSSKTSKSACSKCKHFIKSYYASLSSCCTSMHIYHQLLIFSIFLSLIVIILEITTHYTCYHNIFKYDYMVSYTNLFVKDIIKQEIEQIISTSIHEINIDFHEKVAPLLLLTILTKELINHDLLSGNVFEDFGKIPETYYDFISNSHLKYYISQKDTIDHLDYDINDPKSVYRNIFKIHYIYTPLLIKSNSLLNNHITNAYIGFYTLDNNNPNKVNNKYYFNFPVENRYNSYTANFFTNDFLIDPKICLDEQCDDVKKHNDIYKEMNWFSNMDLMFRKEAESIGSELSITSLIHFREDILTASSMNVVQFYIDYQDTKIIVNYFFKYDNNASHSPIDDIVDYSLFAIKNRTSGSSYMKYSDNETYVVTISDFVNIDQCEILNNIYRYTHKRKNNLFYSQGINYDTFDLQLFNNIEQYFNITNRFKSNSKIFTNILLYASIPTIQPLNELIINMNTFNNDDLYYNIITDKSQIETLCNKFNFKEYNDMSICRSEKEMYFYNKANDFSYDKTKLYSYPNCECIPYYCLNLTEENIVYADKIKLPSKCVLNIDNYYLEEEEENNKDEYSDYDVYDTYVTFTWMPIPFLPELSVLIVSMVNNTLYNDINVMFYKNMEDFLGVVMLIFFIILVSTLLLMIIFFYVRLKRLSNVISQYMSKHISFLFNTEYNEAIEINNNININDEIIINNNGNEDSLLIRNDTSINKRHSLHSITSNNNNKSLSNENSLINDLFLIYCNYYNLDPQQMQVKTKNKINTNNNNQIFDNKTYIMNKKNDLFEMLSSFSQNIMKFKFYISSNINLYENSKFNMNFIKGISKLNKYNSKQLNLTQGILLELLSSECVNDHGFIMNMRFNYNDCVYIKSNDYIKKCMLNCMNNKEKEVKLIGRRKEELFDILEQNIESDEVFTLKMFESSFNYYLIHIYYKYYENLIQHNTNILE